MSGLASVMSIVGIVAAAVLLLVYLKMRQKDQIGAMLEKRRSSAKLVSRADYVEGAETIPVALALTDDTFYYENPDMEASFDLNRIDEIEYSDELMTGKNHGDDCRVLRLRSHGTAFEFLVEKAESRKWETALPARTLGAVAHAV
ncbi:MAG TPA: hypothetical protein VM733_13460 [Thermoanaerobaculia bacterium]|nr:hypothetical protein [Thermoanaerobaculia bacterium]